MDDATAQKLVDSLDRELERRRRVREAQEEARWRAESDDDPVFFARHYLDRLVGRIGAKSAEEAAELVLASVDDDADRERLERVEELAEWFRATAEMVEKLEARDADVAAGIVRRRPVPKIRVRSEAKLLLESPRPKLDPAAPRVVERTGRRGAAPMVQRDEDVPVWKRAQILTWNMRDWTGTVRSVDGLEYKIADGTLARSGLMTLVVGMRCECRIVGAEVDLIRAAWH
jgi:hypothetical protein